jgi:hypothetical protein
MLCSAARDDYDWKLEQRVPPGAPNIFEGCTMGFLGVSSIPNLQGIGL